MKIFLCLVSVMLLSSCAMIGDSQGYGADKVLANYRPVQSRRAPGRAPANVSEPAAEQKCEKDCPQADKKP